MGTLYICPVKYSWEPPEMAPTWRMSKEVHQPGAAAGQIPSPNLGQVWETAWAAGLFLVLSCSCWLRGQDVGIVTWSPGWASVECTIRSALKSCAPTPLRSCLAVRELFCPQLRKKSTKRTSLRTKKGTSLGFYPKVKRKKREKKRLTHSEK